MKKEDKKQVRVITLDKDSKKVQIATFKPSQSSADKAPVSVSWSKATC